MTPSRKLLLLAPIVDRIRRVDYWIANKGGSPGHRTTALTETLLVNHLNGTTRIGACPMQQGSSKTRLALLDLDDHDKKMKWTEVQDIATKIIEMGSLVDVEFIPFRSSGGRGMHLYAIWPEPQEARDVRAFLSGILNSIGYSNGTKGLQQKQIEIFPKQDVIPADGWGNMFVLPCAGNSMSVPLHPETLQEIHLADVEWPDSLPAPPAPVVERAVVTVEAGSVETARIRSALMHVDPNELDYDQWIRIVMAVSHGTNGSAEGHALIHEWSSQFSRYDPAETDKQWDWAKPDKPGGITVNTLFAEARRRGWVEAPNADGFENLDEAAEAEGRRAAQEITGPMLLDDVSVDEIVAKVRDLSPVAQRTAIAEIETVAPEAAREARYLLSRVSTSAGVSTVQGGEDKPMPSGAFPHLRKVGKGMRPINHSANYVALLDHYKVAIAYDVIRKDVRATVGGQPLPKSDNEGEVLLRRVEDFCNLNGVPSEGLGNTLTALAAGNPINPVVDVLSQLKWDGKPRFDAMAEAVGASNGAAARAAFRIFLIQACAAADGAERGMRANPAAQPKYEMILLLRGEQGAKKTSGMRMLLPRALREYFQDGITLVIGDRDSERRAVACWIGELGELEATFRRSDVAQLKSFMSRREDALRVAYGRSDSKFQRRTTFVGSVNSERVLADLTGNRRYAALSITSMAIGWSDDEIEQLWAEAWHRYCQGEQWWPTEAEAEIFKGAVEDFESESEIEERLLARYDWEHAMHLRVAKRLPVTDLLDAIRGSGRGGPYSRAVMDEMRETMRRLWRKRGAKLKNGDLCVQVLDRWVPVYAKGGKNYGMLLPPDRTGGDRGVGDLF